MLGLYPLQLRGDKRQCRIPGNRDERFAAPSRAATGGAVLQPAFSNHGLRDPAFVIERGRYRIQNFRGIGIAIDR